MKVDYSKLEELIITSKCYLCDLPKFKFEENFDFELKYNRICVLGPKRSGKTFIISQLFDTFDDKKYYQNELSFLKLVDNKILIEEPKEIPKESKLKYYVTHCNIVIYVVKNYGYKQQLEVNQIIKLLDKTKILIIVHNPLDITDLGHYQNYNRFTGFLENIPRMKVESYNIQELKSHTFCEIKRNNNRARTYHFFLRRHLTANRAINDGLNHNCEVFNDIQYLIGNFMGLGDKYEKYKDEKQKNIAPNYTLKINDNTLEISVDLPGGEEVNDEIKWDPTTLQFTFSLKAKKKEIIPVNGTPLVEKIEKGVYELNLKLQYLNYPIINMIPQKENQNGRHTFKFELLVTGYEKY